METMERSTDGISPHRLQPPVSQLSRASGRWIGGWATQGTLIAFRCCWLLTHRFLRAAASQQASSNGFAKRRVSTMLSGRDWLGGLARSGASAMAVCRSRLILFSFSLFLFLGSLALLRFSLHTISSHLSARQHQHQLGGCTLAVVMVVVGWCGGFPLAGAGCEMGRRKRPDEKNGR